MRFGRVCGAAMLALGACHVHADQPRQYFGIFGSDAQFVPDKGPKQDAGNLGGKLGFDFNKFVAVEGHAGLTLNDSHLSSPEVTYLAGFVRANLPLERINIYGLLGVGFVDANFAQVKGDFTDLAVGAGIEFYGTENTALGIEYLQYGLDDKYKTVGLGIVHHFNWPKLR
ncbi:MAG: outer membrane beta-barrel protein [Thiotrichales bacterium]